VSDISKGDVVKVKPSFCASAWIGALVEVDSVVSDLKGHEGSAIVCGHILKPLPLRVPCEVGAYVGFPLKDVERVGFTKTTPKPKKETYISPFTGRVT
jgi:hypothetical protein